MRLNPEWFRNSPSTLERTLRRPILYREALRLFLVHFLPLWFFTTWALKILFGFGLGKTSGVGLIAALLLEMFWLRWWYQHFWLPAHLRRIHRIKQLATTAMPILTSPRVRTDKINLCTSIEESIRLATRGLVEIGYLAFPSWGWEIVFRALYPLMVSTKNVQYHELLIGFPNKLIEGDQMLWKIAEMGDRDREKRITEYIEDFGSKVDDVDLALPTLAEKPKVIASMIALYRNSPSPLSFLHKAASRREKATEEVLKHLRVPRGLFKAFLDIVQKNVQLREDRRHYEFLGDFSIRLMLKELARRIRKTESEFFQMSWHEIKTIATHD